MLPLKRIAAGSQKFGVLGACCVALCATSAFGDLRQNPFWQRSAGLWSSEATYLDHTLKFKIPQYSTIANIELATDQVRFTETKFYPAKTFYLPSLKQPIPADKGVEFVQHSVANQVGTTGDVVFSSTSELSAKLLIKMHMLSDDTAQMTAHSRDTGGELYRQLWLVPSANHRYVVNLGLSEHDTNQGGLRGLAFFNGKKIAASELQGLIARWRKRYNVGVRVTYSDNKYVVEELR